MRKWTWQEIKDKIESEFDLVGETFISEDELLGYANEAIDDAEANIHTLYEDYFLTDSSLTIVSGQSDYDLPSDIYANKIRKIMFDDGNEYYTVRRIKHLDEIPSFDEAIETDIYKYLITNSATDGRKIRLYPAGLSDDDGQSYIKLWYIRNANRLVELTDECDIPEFIDYVLQYMRVMCYKKEVGHPNTQMALARLSEKKQLMADTLGQLVDDKDSYYAIDTSFYDDMA